jgi:flagellar biosynthetic protein FlhB
MADEDKQFDATPQKLQKAREEGQVFKSQDLVTALFLLAMLSLLFALAPMIFKELASLFILVFEQIPQASIEKIGWQYLALLTAKALLITIVPFLLAGALVGAIANVIQVGPLIATKAISPKFDKLNPINGFKNIFSQRTVIELIKNILKMLILGYVAYMVMMEFLPKLLISGDVDNVLALVQILGSLMLRYITVAGVLFLVIGGADFMYQRGKFLKDQKMSLKEIKDEFKNSEGDPHVKAALRQRRMQMLQQRMLQAVPTADVITTNPIHLAVAIKYDPDSMQAPQVVAKGTERFAERIKEIAREHHVPIVENAPVARALFNLVDLDREIPANLYQAVAEILLFAWRMRGVAPPRAASASSLPGA